MPTIAATKVVAKALCFMGMVCVQVVLTVMEIRATRHGG
jgi:hypothetical protein